MILKRTIKVSLIVVLSFFFIGLTALSCFFLFVPHYVESEIIPSIAKDNGIEISSLKVRGIGFNGAEISDVRIGPDNDKSLQIASILIDYSISGLIDRQIDRIVLNGISGNVTYENNSLSVAGLDNLLKKRDSNGKNNKGTAPPFEIKKIRIDNSVVNLMFNGNDCMVPFDLTASAFDQTFLPGNIRVRAYPDGNSITIEGKRDSVNKIKLAVKAGDVSLSSLEDILNEIIPADIKGKAGIDFSATLSPDGFSISDISGSCRLDRTVFGYSGVVLKNPSGPGTNENPVEITINSKDARHWAYKVSPVIVVYDTLSVKSNLSGMVEFNDGALKGETDAITRLITGNNEPAIQWRISADRKSSTDSLKVRINGKPEEENKAASIKTTFNGINISALSPEINAIVEYDKEVMSGSYLFRLKKIDADTGEMNFSAPEVSVKGSISQADKSAREYVSSFSFKSREITFKGLDIASRIPEYNIKGTVKYNRDKGLAADARLIFKKGVMSMNDGLDVKGISGEIPVVWPFYGTQNKGWLHVEGITYGKYFLGPIDMKIPQKGKKVSFTGTVKYPVLPDMTINLSGKTLLDSAFSMADIRVNIPAYQPSSSLNLGKIITELKGYSFNGLIKSNAEIKISNSQLSSGLHLGIESGKINNSEKKLTLDNISLHLSLEDLIHPRSSFGQKLKIGRISFGNIEANDFQVDFRVDSLTSLFIEQGMFKWCGGNINIQSFRIDPEKDEYLLTLFCDRLRLADILEQFGVKGVSGGGTVNGKIPVAISKGKIRFEDGFFYSTPGGGGKISIQGTDIFKTGMTPGSPAYTQADIASEALKAYDYSWVKMAVNSEKDELTVKLQFDGKPENQLPFRYDKDLNQFKRVKKGVPGANFQGISIDVNFRVPLDELLNYKGALDMINF